ncbi:MAG TPA: SRPBCC domain-containing protein [Devosiaceae bacterium]|nr:SRPBCC domain-containing protein [Devosiaceae bacterium]
MQSETAGMKPQYTVSARIEKPLAEVFDAVVDPKKLSAYFTTAGPAPGPLVAGTRVLWWGKVAVDVVEVVENARLVLEWAGRRRGGDTPIRIEMEFEDLGDGATLVSISESGYGPGGEVLPATYSTCEGWTQMLCSLKAWLEHGINLRQGYYLGEVSGELTIENNATYRARTRTERG